MSLYSNYSVDDRFFSILYFSTIKFILNSFSIYNIYDIKNW